MNGISRHFRQRNAFLKTKLIYLRIRGKTCGKNKSHSAHNKLKIRLTFNCKMHTMILQTNIWDSKLKDVPIHHSITTHAILMRKLTNLSKNILLKDGQSKIILTSRQLEIQFSKKSISNFKIYYLQNNCWLRICSYQVSNTRLIVLWWV